MQTNRTGQLSVPINAVLHGDCISIMRSLPVNSIDLILTDPPYLVRYQDREGRFIQNDSNADWLIPAFSEAYRVLKQDRFMISFYGWTQVDKFFHAWRSAGFRIVGHLVFRKKYTSKSRFLKYQHEQAYLLAKGNPTLPQTPIADVIDMPYSGNKLHPTQKSVAALKPLIDAFTQQGDVVLDPFCGSGSTLLAAKILNRRYLGIELDTQYHAAATTRLHGGGIRASQRVYAPQKEQASRPVPPVSGALGSSLAIIRFAALTPAFAVLSFLSSLECQSVQTLQTRSLIIK
ncbi:DNA methyltransferase [Granulicella sp. dw_53]|uniref:DNA methyltransferase n=1 Tax=Granulicella sp. dw_53 TaxID=2719792 RepID=UPI001BD511EB|nr:DNA methyltransferase [Granulicella sp. dw_53]